MSPRSKAITSGLLHAKALRVLADELDAGTRVLSPEMIEALHHELGALNAHEPDVDELTQEEWEKAWAEEIDTRLENHRLGKSQAHDLGAFLEELATRR